MEFANVLKQQRMKRGLSQEQLADQLHIARQSISKWERGEAYPSIGMLLQLSEVFDITIDELLKGDQGLKNTIVKDGEKINHPRLKLFFDWVFLTGAALLLARLTVLLLVKFGVIDWNIELLRGWLPSLIPISLMIVAGVASDELKKDIRR